MVVFKIIALDLLVIRHCRVNCRTVLYFIFVISEICLTENIFSQNKFLLGLIDRLAVFMKTVSYLPIGAGWKLCHVCMR